MRDLEAFRDQVFYAEAVRLRDEQRQRLGVGCKAESSNVIQLDQYRRKVQRLVDQPPLKPAS
jgi:hypothetical protein